MRDNPFWQKHVPEEKKLAIYLHQRLVRGWKGKAAAIFAAVGFICVIFTYIGVNTLLPGIHSYA